MMVAMNELLEFDGRFINELVQFDGGFSELIEIDGY